MLRNILCIGFLLFGSLAIESRAPALYIEKLKDFHIPEVETQTPKAWVRELGENAPLFDYFEAFAAVPDSQHMLWKTRWVERLTRKDALRERVFFDKDSLGVIRYELEKLQLDEKGWFDVDSENKRARFEYYKNKTWKQSEDNYKYDLLIGALIPQYIHKKQKELLEGKEVRISLAVPFMRAIYTFVLKKHEDGFFQGQPVVSIRMKATNFLVRNVTKPLYFFYSPAEGKVKKIEGKVFLKKRTGSDPDEWESFQAETLFLDPSL